MDVIPYFKELKEQGYTGKQKINRITRYIGVLFAFIQGYVFTVIYSGTTDVLTILKSTVVITAGTSLLLWIGDQITKRGIGNGLSLLIMAGIIQSMPQIFVGAFNALTAMSDNKVLGGAIFASFVIVYLLIIVGMVWIQLAERRIPIQYANRTNSAYGKHQNFLPIKINSNLSRCSIIHSSLYSFHDINLSSQETNTSTTKSKNNIFFIKLIIT